MGTSLLGLYSARCKESSIARLGLRTKNCLTPAGLLVPRFSSWGRPTHLFSGLLPVA
jgi:hypothetical protein